MGRERGIESRERVWERDGYRVRRESERERETETER